MKKLASIAALFWLAATTAAAQDVFVTVRLDLRRCVSPLCGGYWVTAVNQAGAQTQYVSGLTGQSQELLAKVHAVDPKELLLQGTYGQTESRFHTRPFIVTQAFEGSGVATEETSGTFVTFTHDRRRCISPLCGGVFITPVNHQGAVAQYVNTLDYQRPRRSVCTHCVPASHVSQTTSERAR